MSGHLLELRHAREYTLEKGTPLQAIVGFGVRATPALVVNGAVKAAGPVPAADALKQVLS